MSVTLAFDVYGTLIDTDGVVSSLQALIGTDDAACFAQTWRDKQLEYSFRRGLMQNYENFSVCTTQALEYTCSYYKVTLSREQKQELLGRYRTLPVFRDVKNGLARLKTANFRLFALSNGSEEAVETLLTAAGIRDFFLAVVSVDEIKSFKPNPEVYKHFLSKSAASGRSAWLISSNPFDVIGAISAGMRAVWIQRSKEVIFDPWGIDPTITAENIEQLSEKLTEYLHKRTDIH